MPGSGSWEIVSIRKKRTLVITCLSSDAMMTAEQVENWARLELPPGSDRGRILGLPWAEARNAGVRMALEGGYAYLFFLDSDIYPLDKQIVLKLIDTGYPVISGLYYQKFHPYFPAAFNMGRDDKGNPVRVPIENFTPGDIVPADFVPAGALLVRRDVLEAAWNKFNKRPFIWGLDTSPVPDGLGGNVPNFSEDYVFSFRVKTYLGIQPHVATGLPAGHETKAIVVPKWVAPMPDYHPLHGVMTARTDVPLKG